MPEFLLELYSEEIPPKLQISARNELKDLLKKHLEEEGVKHKSISSFSSPTRLVVFITNIPQNIEIASKEIKGPKVDVPENILNSFMKAHNISKKEVFVKKNEKGNFYFAKTKSKKIIVKDLLTKIVLNSIASLNWRKSI